MRKILFIGLVWPEPNSSAAGTRIIQLIKLFQLNKFEVHFASSSKKGEFSYPLENIAVTSHDIKINHSSFNEFVKELNPEIVIYDRFVIEEQYSWRVRESRPDAIHILDTEDLHFLRKARKKFRKKDLSLSSLFEVPETIRELSSIYRSDLSLIISSEEMKVLKKLQIPEEILFELPFLENSISMNEINQLPSFSERKNFVFIGNFIHPPNWDAVLHLKKIWPEIREKLKDVETHIYGAYPSEKVYSLNNEKEGFIIKGRADDAISTLSKYRVLLAPLTFGAGIKGKFLDCIKAGTPFVTTGIGLEGLKIMNKPVSIEEMGEQAVKLYSSTELWEKNQEENVKSFNSQFSNEVSSDFLLKLKMILENLETHRLKNIVGKIILSNEFQSKKFMSLWLEEKNKG